MKASFFRVSLFLLCLLLLSDASASAAQIITPKVSTPHIKVSTPHISAPHPQTPAVKVLMTGKHFNTATMTVRKGSEKGTAKSKTFARVKLTYKPQNADGKVITKPVH